MEFISGIYFFKAEHPVLNQPDDVDLELAGDIKQITLQKEGMDIVLVGNFSLSAQNNRFVSFPASGSWYNFLRVRKSGFLLFPGRLILM